MWGAKITFGGLQPPKPRPGYVPSAIVTKVSNALNTLVSGEKPGFQALFKGLIVDQNISTVILQKSCQLRWISLQPNASLQQ